MEAAPLAPDGWTTASYWRIIWKMWSGTDTDGFVLLGRHRQAPIIHRGQFICWELGTRRRHRRVNNYSLCRLFWVGLKNMIVSGWRLYCNFFRHSFRSSKLKIFHLNACINIFMRQQARKDEKQWSGTWSDVNIKGVAIFQSPEIYQPSQATSRALGSSSKGQICSLLFLCSRQQNRSANEPPKQLPGPPNLNGCKIRYPLYQITTHSAHKAVIRPNKTVHRNYSSATTPYSKKETPDQSGSRRGIRVERRAKIR